MQCLQIRSCFHCGSIGWDLKCEMLPLVAADHGGRTVVNTFERINVPVTFLSVCDSYPISYSVFTSLKFKKCIFQLLAIVHCVHMDNDGGFKLLHISDRSVGMSFLMHSVLFHISLENSWNWWPICKPQQSLKLQIYELCQYTFQV